MIYFSGGLTRNGIENQASLRAATNEAAKANMAIYTVDSRGLQALPPVGDASKGSLRGNSAYSGSAATAQLAANYGSQETLGTLAADTGGKFFGDSNDFGPAFQQVQHDTEAYYILGFHSTDQTKDGAFRHLTVKLNRNDVKLEYRPGYYAPADFQHQKTEDRELALTEAMRSDIPATDVAVYLPPERGPVLRARQPHRAGFSHPVHQKRRHQQGIDRHPGPRAERAGHHGRHRAGDRQARSRCIAAGPAPQHSVLHRLYPSSRKISHEVCCA
jgi:hypothetical protein